ncbi:DUF1525 domain-containing protein [Vibrio parahaemolyticus]|nr:DUF1525 domain-containing protein [Vibrio parahaemolyticus]
MNFKVLALSLFPYFALGAPQDYWPNKVEYFVAGAVPDKEMRILKRILKDTSFVVYDLSAERRVLSDLESSVPASVVAKGETKVHQYIESHIAPQIEARVHEIASAKVGQGLSKMYKLEYLPAVVIDSEFVTYGLGVMPSIGEFQRAKDEEAR